MEIQVKTTVNKGEVSISFNKKLPDEILPALEKLIDFTLTRYSKPSIKEVRNCLFLVSMEDQDKIALLSLLAS